MQTKNRPAKKGGSVTKPKKLLRVDPTDIRPRLHAYGDAIDPQLASEFIIASLAPNT